MNKQEVKDGNKLIAEFMGWEISEKDLPYRNYSLVGIPEQFRTVYGYGNAEPFSELTFKNLQFHASWDWLMPVPEKIEELGYNTLISKGFVVANYGTQVCAIGQDFAYREFIDTPDPVETKLEAVYSAVVNFIKQYNVDEK